MKIVPAILAESLDVFITRLRQAEKFANYIQIDIMDGKFVDTRSLDPEMLNHITIAVPFEIHLMVEDPLKTLMNIRNPSLRKAIFHVEAGGNPIEFIKKAKKRGFDVGLAVKPETPLDGFEDLAQHVDTLLFLTATRPAIITTALVVKKRPGFVTPIKGHAGQHSCHAFETYRMVYLLSFRSYSHKLDYSPQQAGGKSHILLEKSFSL